MICYNEFEDDDLKNHPSFSLLDLKNKTIIGELKLQTPSSEKEHLMWGTTCFAYDETSFKVYSGHKDGRVIVWK